MASYTSLSFLYEVTESRLNPSGSSGYIIYHQVEHYKIPRSAHTVCMFYMDISKQGLFPCTALTDWSLKSRRSVFTARYEFDL